MLARCTAQDIASSLWATAKLVQIVDREDRSGGSAAKASGKKICARLVPKERLDRCTAALEKRYAKQAHSQPLDQKQLENLTWALRVLKRREVAARKEQHDVASR
eukprot:scaffold3051_cov236-Pinguiococcus_pyrenoidosus.AAC.8